MYINTESLCCTRVHHNGQSSEPLPYNWCKLQNLRPKGLCSFQPSNTLFSFSLIGIRYLFWIRPRGFSSFAQSSPKTYNFIRREMQGLLKTWLSAPPFKTGSAKPNSSPWKWRTPQGKPVSDPLVAFPQVPLNPGWPLCPSGCSILAQPCWAESWPEWGSQEQQVLGTRNLVSLPFRSHSPSDVCWLDQSMNKLFNNPDFLPTYKLSNFSKCLNLRTVETRC